MGLATAPGPLTHGSVERQEHGSPCRYEQILMVKLQVSKVWTKPKLTHRTMVTWSFMMATERVVPSGAPGQTVGREHLNITMARGTRCNFGFSRCEKCLISWLCIIFEALLRKEEIYALCWRKEWSKKEFNESFHSSVFSTCFVFHLLSQRSCSIDHCLQCHMAYLAR